MSDRKTRICALCKTQYQFCPQCSPEDAKKPTWYFTFCSENCHDIYAVTSGFEDGRIKDIDAKAQLGKLDLSKLENFGESYKLSIAEINSVKIQQPVKIKYTNKSSAENVDEKKEKKVVKKPKEIEAEDVE